MDKEEPQKKNMKTAKGFAADTAEITSAVVPKATANSISF